MSLIRELKRRNVFRVGVAYLAASWLLFEVLSTLFEVFGSPDWVLKTIVTLLAVGLPITLVFSWAYEITPEGLKKTREVGESGSITHSTGRRLDQITIGIVILAIAVLAVDRIGLISRVGPAPAGQTAATVQSTTAEPAESAPSIAVLPFVDMSADKDQEYLSDGLAEELLNLLARIPELQVAARTSSFSFKGQNLEIPEVAERLNVAHVLEGSVRKAGGQVRITAQLIQASDGYHLWSKTYDRTLEDIFAIQDEIAAKVVEQLKITLLGEAPHVAETDPEAYALYLQARHLADQITAEGLAQAVGLYQRVLALDPAYAPAWAGLAHVYHTQAGRGLLPIDQGLPRAREAADRALVLDPNNAQAHASLGWIAMSYDRNLSAAAGHLQRALALAPTDTNIIRNAATLLVFLGRLEDAIVLEEFATARDPVNPVGHVNLGHSYRSTRRWDAAIASYKTAQRLSPDYIGAQYFMGTALLFKGEAAAGLEAMQREEFEGYRLIGLSMAYHALGDAPAADAAMAELIEEYEQEAAYNIAYVLAYRLEADRAFEWLDKAVEYGDPGLSDIVGEPAFGSIHGDPRWLPFLESIGQSPAQLDAIEFEVTLPGQ